MSKALSGTSILSSSHKLTLLEMLTIPFSFQPQLSQPLKIRNTSKTSKEFMKLVDMEVEDMTTNGNLVRHTKTS